MFSKRVQKLFFSNLRNSFWLRCSFKKKIHPNCMIFCNISKYVQSLSMLAIQGTRSYRKWKFWLFTNPNLDWILDLFENKMQLKTSWRKTKKICFYPNPTYKSQHNPWCTIVGGIACGENRIFFFLVKALMFLISNSLVIFPVLSYNPSLFFINCSSIQ